MSRKLSNTLLKKMQGGGTYAKLLQCINNDPKLSLEVRIKGQLMIYYKKSKILTLFPRREPELLSNGYHRGKEKPRLDLRNPSLYFDKAQKLVNKHTKSNDEFTIQQKLVRDNSTLDNRYLIIDMEYQFAQENIENRTKEKTRFDLLAIDRDSYNVVLIELKQGSDALDGKSGVEDHESKYEEHIKRNDFQTALFDDVRNIVEAKQALGVYAFETENLLEKVDRVKKVEYKVIFAYDGKKEKNDFLEKYEGKNYETIYVPKGVDVFTL